MGTIFNEEKLINFNSSLFHTAKPYEHYNFSDLIKKDFFDTLVKTYPTTSVLFKDEPPNRKYGQRPHHRYYASYDKFGNNKKLLPISINKLENAWQEFVNEIYNNKIYHDFLKICFNINKIKIRIDWHCTPNGKDVSPHIDSSGKIGTHLFYFNTDYNWKLEWGGGTLVLGKLKNKLKNPEIEDFDIKIESSIMNNKSFLFKNGPNSWHAVDKIKCPKKYYRKLCSVVILK